MMKVEGISLCESLWSDRGVSVPQIVMESGADQLLRETMEQIVASSATDHEQIVKSIQLAMQIAWFSVFFFW